MLDYHQVILRFLELLTTDMSSKGSECPGQPPYCTGWSDFPGHGEFLATQKSDIYMWLREDTPWFSVSQSVVSDHLFQIYQIWGPGLDLLDHIF